MQNKKLILILGIFILVVSVASFIAGRMLNRGVSPLSLFGPVDDGILILPAKELPESPAEAEGLFVERQDNIIIVESDQAGGDSASGSPVGVGGGPKTEVVVTTTTLVYYDITQPPARRPTGNDPRVLQQIVEVGTLDDLQNSQSWVMVWGRRTGERVIADVLLYSNPAYLQKP